MISLCCAWGNNSFSLTQSFQRMKKHLGKKLWTRESCVPLSALSLTAAYKCLVAESSTCGGGGETKTQLSPAPSVPQAAHRWTRSPWVLHLCLVGDRAGETGAEIHNCRIAWCQTGCPALRGVTGSSPHTHLKEGTVTVHACELRILSTHRTCPFPDGWWVWSWVPQRSEPPTKDS